MRNFIDQAFTSTETFAAILGVITVVCVITIFVLGWNYWRIGQQRREIQRRRDWFKRQQKTGTR